MTTYIYAVFFNGQRTELQADSLYAAKLKGITYFSPRKAQQHMVTPVLIEKDEKPVNVTVD